MKSIQLGNSPPFPPSKDTPCHHADDIEKLLKHRRKTSVPRQHRTTLFVDFGKGTTRTVYSVTIEGRQCFDHLPPMAATVRLRQSRGFSVVFLPLTLRLLEATSSCPDLPRLGWEDGFYVFLEILSSSAPTRLPLLKPDAPSTPGSRTRRTSNLSRPRHREKTGRTK